MGDQTDRLLLEVEFTHRWYRAFLERLRADGYAFRGFTGTPGRGDVVCRHDVDLSLDAAVTMAEMEADLGVESTYFVLLTSPLYNAMRSTSREAIRRIEGLGHDVGLHFSTHAYPELDRRPPAASVERRVRAELDVLNSLLEGTPTGVSFHIPPAWALGAEFEGFTSAYAPAYFSESTYVADSSQRWRDEPPAVGPGDGPVQVLTHPGLWAETDGTFEERVEGAIESACWDARAATRAEFLDGGSD